MADLMDARKDLVYTILDSLIAPDDYDYLKGNMTNLITGDTKQLKDLENFMKKLPMDSKGKISSKDLSGQDSPKSKKSGVSEPRKGKESSKFKYLGSLGGYDLSGSLQGYKKEIDELIGVLSKEKTDFKSFMFNTFNWFYDPEKYSGSIQQKDLYFCILAALIRLGMVGRKKAIIKGAQTIIDNDLIRSLKVFTDKKGFRMLKDSIYKSFKKHMTFQNYVDKVLSEPLSTDTGNNEGDATIDRLKANSLNELFDKIDEYRTSKGRKPEIWYRAVIPMMIGKKILSLFEEDNNIKLIIDLLKNPSSSKTINTFDKINSNIMSSLETGSWVDILGLGDMSDFLNYFKGFIINREKIAYIASDKVEQTIDNAKELHGTSVAQSLKLFYEEIKNWNPDQLYTERAKRTDEGIEFQIDHQEILRPLEIYSFIGDDVAASLFAVGVMNTENLKPLFSTKIDGVPFHVYGVINDFVSAANPAFQRPAKRKGDTNQNIFCTFSPTVGDCKRFANDYGGLPYFGITKGERYKDEENPGNEKFIANYLPFGVADKEDGGKSRMSYRGFESGANSENSAINQALRIAGKSTRNKDMSWEQFEYLKKKVLYKIDKWLYANGYIDEETFPQRSILKKYEDEIKRSLPASHSDVGKDFVYK